MTRAACATRSCSPAPRTLSPRMSPPRPVTARIAVAREVCASCPVRLACLAYTLRTRPAAGVWAGFTPEEDRRPGGRREPPGPGSGPNSVDFKNSSRPTRSNSPTAASTPSRVTSPRVTTGIYPRPPTKRCGRPYSTEVQQRPRTIASSDKRQHTELAGRTAKRSGVPLVRDEGASVSARRRS